MAFLSFHVFFYDLHPELEFMWVLMQKQAGYVAVYPVLKGFGEAFTDGRCGCGQHDGQSIDSELRTIHKLPAARARRM